MKMMNWKMLKICLILLGVLCLIFAFCISEESVGSYEYSETYGGDAYTGIQNAAAQAANNIRAVGSMIQSAAGYLLTAQGIGFILFGLCIRTKKKAVPAPAPVETEPAPVQTEPAAVSAE